MFLSKINADLSNIDKIAIVVVGYNRVHSIRRLLNSLLSAEYPSQDVPLVISIDCSGDTELYDYVKIFEWPYGNKYLNIQEHRLGLKKHIIQCGDLSQYFKAIILLEDDIFVSPAFYSYTTQVVDKYGDDDRIGQISLYKDESFGFSSFPFQNYQNGNDVFLLQSVNSWGECWTKKMWKDFREWYNTHTDDDIKNADIPQEIKFWTKAWSKYYHTYLVDTDRFVIYPNISLTTNFSDAGVHGSDNHALVQSNLQQNSFLYRLSDYDNLVKYDIYCNNLDTYKWIDIPKEELTLDYYGINLNTSRKRYILSTKILPYPKVKSFGLYMRPIELNVKYNLVGEGLYLYDTNKHTINQNKTKYDTSVIAYFLRNFSRRLLLEYSFRYYFKRLLCKLRLNKN